MQTVFRVFLYFICSLQFMSCLRFMEFVFQKQIKFSPITATILYYPKRRVVGGA